MKKAVMYGAGNIGRGFMGKVFSNSGYDVCFIDIAENIIDKLNTDKCYPVRTVYDNNYTEETVENVRAVNAMDNQAIEEIAFCDIMATAVGVNVLPKIVSVICEGIKRRIQIGKSSLDVILCENQLNADKILRNLIEENMRSEYKGWLDANLGLVEASIGRMVPVMTSEMQEGNILRIWVEPYCILPVDKLGFKGNIPNLKGLVPFTPFEFYIKRKLFLHNMGHGMCAYLGYQRGYTYIWQSALDDKIQKKVKSAMMEVAKALNKKYGVSLEELVAHIDDLLERFANKLLGDTIVRVARDPARKLRNNDRFVGAALLCVEQGFNSQPIVDGIVSSLYFDNPKDTSACDLQKDMAKYGIEYIVSEYMQLKKNSPIYKMISDTYKRSKF
ncbi:mannitol dehydrogenase family protein [Clostridium psychrophilum]|uniref:mannitol dehydrogenase family protein n=1 Tax=Clostridium psychrophilum TaxID=132926 RepID=UPI001C0C23DD|nr:mannitol dehydrogenase [Clostridium psychrophilum]MBU3182815.1 mannitol dehydrogenase [Clostridium psychrophilum]